MMASEAAARVTSVSVMPPTAECTMLMRTSDWSILSKASRRASMEPCTSAFTMRFRSVCLAVLDAAEQVVQAHVALGLLLGQAGAQRALLGQLAGVALVLEDAELVAGGGHAVQAQDLHRVGGASASATCLPCGFTRARTRP